MARKVYNTTLNASTIDILNVIRANAGLQYQAQVPEVETLDDIPKIGDILYGYPALANTFLTELMNRIALVLIKSSMYNDPYKVLKKGEIDYGETVEEVFVEIAKAREFNPEKTKEREFQRTLPDVRTAFHVINSRLQYPITVQDVDIRQAFVSAEGVRDMIERVIQSIYTGWEYDEYLLFKYLLIKGVSSGKMYPVAFDSSNMANAAKVFRSTANKLTFLSTKYNAAGVHTVTSKEDQVIFMDSDFAAAYDVDVLANAFNMTRAEYTERLFLIDDWTTFDNERFDEVRKGSDQIEEVTDEELALMANVKAVILDREWFQFYDNVTKLTEDYAGSGMYMNYWLNKWNTVSSSPFSNAIVLVDNVADTADPDSVRFEVTSKDIAETATVITVEPSVEGATFAAGSFQVIQTVDAVTNSIAITKTGSIVIPAKSSTVDIIVEVASTSGTRYRAAAAINANVEVGTLITLNKVTE